MWCKHQIKWPPSFPSCLSPLRHKRSYDLEAEGLFGGRVSESGSFIFINYSAGHLIPKWFKLLVDLEVGRPPCHYPNLQSFSFRLWLSHSNVDISSRQNKHSGKIIILTRNTPGVWIIVGLTGYLWRKYWNVFVIHWTLKNVINHLITWNVRFKIL